MKVIDICPSCLTELPDGYPFDHVRIDKALGPITGPDLFRAMSKAERREVVLTALRRGVTMRALAERLNFRRDYVQGLLPDEHPESRMSNQVRLEEQIRTMWSKGDSDQVIALLTDWEPSKIGRTRQRLGLPTKRKPADWKATWAW
jgi:hypothetical protein